MSEDTQLHTEDLARPTGAPVVATTEPSEGPRDQAQAAEAQAPGDGSASRIDEVPNRSREQGSEWATLLGDTSDLSSRWLAIQAGFVDEPRRAVEEADGLVAELIQRLARTFAAERGSLPVGSSANEALGNDYIVFKNFRQVALYQFFGPCPVYFSFTPGIISLNIFPAIDPNS